MEESRYRSSCMPNLGHHSLTEHPDTAMSLNNLADLLRSQGDYAEAKPLLERALVISEKALGCAENQRLIDTLVQNRASNPETSSFVLPHMDYPDRTPFW